MKSVLSIENLSVRFKGSTQFVLDDVSFKVFPGDAVLLDGKNGSGKSTLLKAILGSETKDKEIRGKIIYNEIPYCAGDPALKKLMARIGYLKQKDFYDLMLGYNVFDVLKDQYQKTVDRRIQKAEINLLKEKFDRYVPSDSGIRLNSRVNKLSGGQQRLLSIFVSLCMNDSDLYLIDEPLNNLDMSMVVYISNLLNQLHIDKPSTSFVVVSHCKIFPFINRRMIITDSRISESFETWVCNTCFGEPNEKGFYS